MYSGKICSFRATPGGNLLRGEGEKFPQRAHIAYTHTQEMDKIYAQAFREKRSGGGDIINLVGDDEKEEEEEEEKEEEE